MYTFDAALSLVPPSGSNDILSSILSSVPDLCSVLDRLAHTLDPSTSDAEDMEQEQGEGVYWNRVCTSDSI